MPGSNGLQLLPETRRRIDINVPGENKLIYTGITVLVLILALVGGLYLYKNNLENKIASLE